MKLNHKSLLKHLKKIKVKYVWGKILVLITRHYEETPKHRVVLPLL